MLQEHSMHVVRARHAWY